MTQAVTLAYWNSSANLRQAVELKYRSRFGESFYARSAGLSAEDGYWELTAAARDEVESRLANFTVVDAVVALDTQVKGWRASFKDTVSAAVVLERFVEPAWKACREFDHKEVWCFPPSASGTVSRRFASLLDEVESSVQFKADREETPEDPNTLLLVSMYFNIPVQTLTFYKHAKRDYQSVQNELRFRPYPELRAETGSEPPVQPEEATDGSFEVIIPE